MLDGSKLGGGGVAATLWPRPINQADVFVRVVDAMDVEKTRRDERARAGRSRGRTFAEQFHVESALFLRLAQRSEEHTSELQSHSDLVCRLLLEKKKSKSTTEDCTYSPMLHD